MSSQMAANQTGYTDPSLRYKHNTPVSIATLQLKWSAVKGENLGILWKVYIDSEEKRSEGHVQIGVQYLRRNNFINYVQHSLPLVLLFVRALLLTVVGLVCIMLLSVVYCCYLMCIVVLLSIAVLHTLVVGLLARSQ